MCWQGYCGFSGAGLAGGPLPSLANAVDPSGLEGDGASFNTESTDSTNSPSCYAENSFPFPSVSMAVAVFPHIITRTS